uniref:Ig-like domain-containing protein n=1 Tax=Salvator merianae TaxID=96440 RepID=A0A8D0B9A1_SALMN
MVSIHGSKTKAAQKQDSPLLLSFPCLHPHLSYCAGRERRSLILFSHPSVAPSASVYPRTPVEMGDPNMLVCLVDRFIPAVLNITWHKSGQQISVGVEETDFYPSDGDVYTCQVEHLGLSEPLQRIWNAKAPMPLPETMENVLCILGLAVGAVGIVTGTILFFKALRMKSNTRSRGPM